jgi:mRNA interferase RelE/StbE
LASRVHYKDKAYKDLKQIDKPIRQVIMDKVTLNLSKIPPDGKPLTGDLAGLYSYRVGDYRVIYEKMQEGVLVLRVGHRREIYKGM